MQGLNDAKKVSGMYSGIDMTQNYEGVLLLIFRAAALLLHGASHLARVTLLSSRTSEDLESGLSVLGKWDPGQSADISTVESLESHSKVEGHVYVQL